MRRGSELTWSSESDSECAGSVDTTSVWWPAAASLTASDAARLVLPTPPLPLWPGKYAKFCHRNCAMWPVVTPGSTPLSLAPTKAQDDTDLQCQAIACVTPLVWTHLIMMYFRAVPAENSSKAVGLAATSSAVATCTTCDAALLLV